MSNVFENEATIAQWDHDYYTPISLWLYDRLVEDMLNDLGAQPGETVLDAGCGPGVHSIRIAKAGINVCAVDISKAMLQHARERVEKAGMSERIEFHQKDLTCLDIPDASFDYVFSWGVVIHIREAEKALDELSRVVKPGGKLALYVTNKAAIDHKIESLARLLRRKPLDLEHLSLGDRTWYSLNGEKLWVWRFDAKSITEYLTDRGFRLGKRRIGEFSEIQTKLNGFPRRLLLRLNNWAYRFGVPPRPGATNLLVFEKHNP